MPLVDFYIWRRTRWGLTSKEPGRKKRLPWFKHKSFDSAEREAKRLAAKYPKSKFLILAVVGEAGPLEHEETEDVKLVG